MEKYDYLIVGAGLFGAVFTEQAVKRGKKCLVVEARPHVGGNVYTKREEGIVVHKYGAHIFHTSDKQVWDYMRSFAPFIEYVHSPLARYGDKTYPLPFTMNTFRAFWGVETAQEAKAKIEAERIPIENPANLEEQALASVGKEFYEVFIKGYTSKQWGRDCRDLPPEVLKRIPLRFSYDNNYFNDVYQGIPQGGYTPIIEKMLEGADLLLNVDYFDFIKTHPNVSQKTLYTGPIDRFFNYVLGALEYRSLRFEQETLDLPNYQNASVVNYLDKDVPFTRIIEHKHFEKAETNNTIITKEYSSEWAKGAEPYYPVNNAKNNALYKSYEALADACPNVIFGGRLGTYRYMDMHVAVRSALDLAQKTLQ